jgi:hypothetical protein
VEIELALTGLSLGQTIILDQFTIVTIQIILNHLNAAVAGRDALLCVKQAIMSQSFPHFHDFDVALGGFPELAFFKERQRGRFGYLHIIEKLI